MKLVSEFCSNNFIDLVKFGELPSPKHLTLPHSLCLKSGNTTASMFRIGINKKYAVQPQQCYNQLVATRPLTGTSAATNWYFWNFDHL